MARAASLALLALGLFAQAPNPPGTPQVASGTVTVLVNGQPVATGGVINLKSGTNVIATASPDAALGGTDIEFDANTVSLLSKATDQSGDRQILRGSEQRRQRAFHLHAESDAHRADSRYGADLHGEHVDAAGPDGDAVRRQYWDACLDHAKGRHDSRADRRWLQLSADVGWCGVASAGLKSEPSISERLSKQNSLLNKLPRLTYAERMARHKANIERQAARMRARRSAVKVASEKRAVDKDADAERQTLLRARRRLAAGEPLTKWQQLTIEEWGWRQKQKHG